MTSIPLAVASAGKSELLSTRAQGNVTFLRGHTFSDELESDRPMMLPPGATLRFLPLVLTDGASTPELTTTLLVDGKQVALDRSKTIQIADLAAHPGLAQEAVVTVDLGRYEGEKVRFKWTTRGGGDAARCAVGMPRLEHAAATSRSRPDVLMVCVDTLRSDYSVGGNGMSLMPELHQLTAQGTSYIESFSTSSWTLPSIASVLTGGFPRFHKTGERGDVIPKETFSSEGVPTGFFPFFIQDAYRLLTLFPRSLTTLPELLSRHGYQCSLVSAQPLYFLSGMHADGFDLAVRTGVVPGDEVNEAAFAAIDARQENMPLFLLVHYMDVHQWQPWYFSKSHPNENAIEARDDVIASYSESVRDADRHLGRLLQRWDERIGLDHSLVVVFSDHGEHLLDPGLGHGNSMDDVLLHVPLVIKYPEALPPPFGESSVVASLADLPFTVLDVLQIPFQERLPGGSSLLSSPRSQPPPPRTLFADYQLYGDSMSSVRRGDFKLVINLDTEERSLFVTGGPPTGVRVEERVVADSMQAELESAFQDYVLSAREATRGLRSEDDVDGAEALRSLRALGYIE